MIRLPARLAGAALIALAAAVPASASAATLKLNRACYTHYQRVGVSGSGYQPNQELSLFVNGRFVVKGKADPAGRLAGHFPALAPFKRPTSVRTYTVTISPSSTGTPVAAQRTFQVVHTNIELTPPFITPGFVTYKALGFTHSGSLYVHYLLGTRHLRTSRIGPVSGPCGSLTKKVRMFLFRPVKPGLYKLIFDNSARYSANYAPSYFFQALVQYTFN